MQLFGFEINRKKLLDDSLESFAPPINDDGAVIVAAGGSYGTYIDLDGTARTESELVSKYREIGLEADIERAVDDIINEMIDSDADKVVQINLDQLKYSDSIKDKIRDEFGTIIDLLNFENNFLCQTAIN